MTSERELTARLATFFPSHRDLQVGIGDDAAVIRQRHQRVVLCCDPVIAGVHFDAAAQRGLVGKKAVNRNLSDLAAMGAVADWLLVSLILPTTTSRADLDALLRGIRSAAVAADCCVVGGDVASSHGPMVVTVSAYGHLPGRALTRSGARAGNTLHVTGPLGGSIHGHHLRFRPALAEGVWLAEQRSVTAAMDISDGLLLDLQTMLAASSKNGAPLGAELNANRIPIRPAARRFDDGQALQHALADGEDHVLLWTQRASNELPSSGPLTKRSRHAIGRVVREPGLWLLQDGERRRLPESGFQHSLNPKQRAPRRTSPKSQ
ncbi:MAG: thiamine-monophosphate kinase [Planctomycetota bacterium]|jgi:thiamine-monophosphate kinase